MASSSLSAAKTDTEPVVLTLEAKFHRICDDGWNNKLIQFPKGGIHWGLHLSKQGNTDNTDMKLVASLICFGPIKKHYRAWALNFDHAFTLSCKRVSSASPIQQSSNFNHRLKCVRSSEWGQQKLALPDNWGTHENVKLSCHMYINHTTGIDRRALKAAATPNPLLVTVQQPQLPLLIPLEPYQIQGQVMVCYSDMLIEEDIEYTPEGFEAAEKLAKFFCFPGVLDVCKRHLMRMQALLGIYANEEYNERSQVRLNLQGFDFLGNCPIRRQRMRNLSENDVINIFQHLTSIVFKKD